MLITGKADPSVMSQPYWDVTNYTLNNSLRVFDDINNNGILDAGEELSIYNPAAYQWTDWRGSFSIYIDANQLAEGSHRLRVIQTDAAGNVATSNAFNFTLDSQMNAFTVALSCDSGTAGDKVSQDASLLITGAEVGADISYSTDGSTWASTYAATDRKSVV